MPSSSTGRARSRDRSALAGGEALSIREFGEDDPTESRVLPGFDQTLVDILGY